MLLALALGCAPGSKWDGTWLMRGDAGAQQTGDCADDTDPVVTGEDNGRLEIYTTGDGEVMVELFGVYLKGLADGKTLEADWEQEDGGDRTAVELNATRDGDTMSGNVKVNVEYADPAYVCTSTIKLTGSRILDTTSHLD